MGATERGLRMVLRSMYMPIDEKGIWDTDDGHKIWQHFAGPPLEL